MKVTKHDGKRYYEIEGESMPSVTTILSVLAKGYGYELWLKNNTREQTDKVSNDAMELGTRVHQHAEDHIKAFMAGEPIAHKIKPDESPAFNAFLDWEEKAKPHYVKSELFLYSKESKFAGTTDIIALVDGELSLIDIKTSKAFYDTMGLQLSAYKKAYEEMYKEKIKRLYILRLDKKTGKHKLKEYKDEFDVFQACLYIFRWRNP